MLLPRSTPLLLALFLLNALSTGATARAEAPWTIDDMVLVERATAWEVAADGKLAVWIKSAVRTIEDEEKPVANVWRNRLPDGDAQPLTRGTERVSALALAPDGAHLAFLTDRPLPAASPPAKKSAGKQLWALPLDGGEAFPLTRLDRAVEAVAWIDAQTLVIVAAESPSAWEQARKEEEDTARVVDDHEHTPPQRLFRVTLDGAVKRLGHSPWDTWIDALAVSPDGRRAVVTARQSLSYEFDQKVPPHTYLVDLTSGARERLLAEGPHLPRTVRWAADSKRFYFIDDYTRHPDYRIATIQKLHVYDLQSKSSSEVDLDWPQGLGGDYVPTADGVIALLADGVRYRPARLLHHGKGWERQDLDGEHVRNIDRWTLGRDGRTLIYRSSAANRPPQWYGARLQGTIIEDARALTTLNERYADKPTGRVEVLRWTGALGETVEGLLHHPLDEEGGGRRPLVLDIHGGPAGVDRDTWDQRWAGPILLWRQRGAYVLQVNYHGSSNYGLDWVESIQGRYYELEIPDIEAGVDHLIDAGLIDPERLACSGWSNGGILCADLITRSQRYRAASIGAADIEWISDWANVDFGASFDNYYFGAPPYEAVETYIEKSPFFRLPEVTTPTLIHTGTEDRAVPPHQSWSLFRVLQQVGRTEARLLLYPGEPHGLRKIGHQRRKIMEDLAWFDRHLFATATPRNEAIRDDSYLAGLLARYRAARHDGVFGRLEQGVLVPETVSYGGLEVGRFEVTRAQLAAFDPQRAAAPGTADHPATGLSFETAKAYVDWLATTTGRPFRLPTEDEAKSLTAATDTAGNTLDHWAGYTPNPNDAARLASALAPLGEAPLLLPVGHLKATPAGVFDLDGNAAEWAVAKGAGGVAVGPSADRPADARNTEPAAAAYTGLRVVLDPQP